MNLSNIIDIHFHVKPIFAQQILNGIQRQYRYDIITTHINNRKRLFVSNYHNVLFANWLNSCVIDNLICQ